MGTSSMEVSFIGGFSIVTLITGGNPHICWWFPPSAELILAEGLCHLKWQSFLPTAL
jgi:hypothetical protein